MRKRVILILTCLFILIGGCLTAGIYAADSDLYKNIDETALESNDSYFGNYRDNYQLDTEKMTFFKNPGSVMFDMFSNAIFSFQVMLSKLTISLFSFSLSSDIATTLGGLLEPFIEVMRLSMWDEFAIFGIAFATFLLLLQMAQNRTAQAMSSMAALVLIVTLAFAFYVYPMQLLNGVDAVTGGIADTVMEGPYQATVGTDGQAQGVKAKASALCWQLFVHQPWQILEFGSVKMAERYQDDILKWNPDSDQRKEKVDQLAESDKLFSKSMSHQISRLTTSIILLLFNILLMAVLIVFSVLILGYQFLVLVYLLLGIFVFLIALIPAFGLPLVKRWGSRIISIAFTRILVVFFLSVTLVFMGVIYKFTDEYGLITTMFLILVIVCSIWFERYRLLDLFSGIRVTGSSINVNRMLDQDFNAVDQSRNVWSKTFADGLEANENQEKRQNTARNNRGSKMEKSMEGDLYVGQKTGDYIEGSGTLDLSRVNESMTVSADKMSTASNDISSYFRRAEETLQQQYDASKAKAEEAAERKQEKPNYSGFVQRTDAVRALGAGTFDQRDISSVAKLIHNTEMQGGHMKDISEKTAMKYPKRPMNLYYGRESERNHESVGSMKHVGKPSQTMDMQFFTQNFGEEMGEECYTATTKKYGKKFVDSFEFVSDSDYGKDKRSVSYAEILRQMEQAKRAELKNTPKNVQSRTKPTAENLRKNEVNDES